MWKILALSDAWFFLSFATYTGRQSTTDQHSVHFVDAGLHCSTVCLKSSRPSQVLPISKLLPPMVTSSGHKIAENKITVLIYTQPLCCYCGNIKPIIYIIMYFILDNFTYKSNYQIDANSFP